MLIKQKKNKSEITGKKLCMVVRMNMKPLKLRKAFFLFSSRCVNEKDSNIKWKKPYV